MGGMMKTHSEHPAVTLSVRIQPEIREQLEDLADARGRTKSFLAAEAIEYYFKAPDDISDRLVIVVDPMLATANSATAAIEKLKERGANNIRFLCLLAAPEGIEAFTRAQPDIPIYTAAIDSHLNEKGYIVPGLGDAGDRMYGTK